MPALYATPEEYTLMTGDSASNRERVSLVLSEQSAKLRALVGIPMGRKLNQDQAEMARSLVIDAARKQLITPSFDGLGNVSGAKQASFSADGFQGSYTFANPSGSAYFDGSMLKAFKRSLRPSQTMRSIMPSIGTGARR